MIVSNLRVAGRRNMQPYHCNSFLLSSKVQENDDSDFPAGVWHQRSTLCLRTNDFAGDTDFSCNI